ncbi:MAG: LamG domain-containing protein, partial [Sedimentisphaerales bacterium]|nr:LamG domain-containing protein [Sedimentisphaerales bacterium]
MCRRLVFTLLLVGVIAYAAQADLVSHWTLDEGAGKTAYDSGPAGNDGTLTDNPALDNPTWIAGVIGGAMEFHGQGVVSTGGDYFDCGNDASLNIYGPISIALWIRPDADDPEGKGTAGGETAPMAKATGDWSWQVRYGWGTATPYMGFQFNTSPRVWVYTDRNLERFEWCHIACSHDGATVKCYLNGVETDSAPMGQITSSTAPVLIGSDGWLCDWTGAIDDVRIYDHGLSEGEILALSSPEPIPTAYGPTPKDGAMITATATLLKWQAGAFARTHDVYFGDSLDAVSTATPDDADVYAGRLGVEMMPVGAEGSPYPEALVPGTTYYWRIDEVNDTEPDSPWKGNVWSFSIQPVTAFNPYPVDGMKFVEPDQDLTWDAGMGALFHTTFLGESFDEVNSATQSNWMSTQTTLDPGPLELGKTYYWRVDEFTATAQTHKGPIWSFTTLPDVPVTDESLLAWWTLDEGEGATVVDWSGHGHHGTLGGDAQWADGYFGSAMHFDGSGDYVDFGTPADLYLTQNYTYTAWFKVERNINGNSGPQYLLCIGSRSDLVFGVEDAVGVDGDLSLHYYDTAPGFHAVGVGQTAWSADEWHMVTGTRDGNGHKVYLDGALVNSDTNTNADNFSGATTRMISLGGRAWTTPQVAFFNGLIDDVRIYNRALAENEIQQVLRGNPLLAGSPNPGPGAVVDIRDATALSWTAGNTAASHDVYFGTDKAALELQGNQPGTSFSLAGLVEMGGGDYFWRIDEVEADGAVQTGYVWRFNVLDFLTVDDFESYTNEVGSRVFEKWIDG